MKTMCIANLGVLLLALHLLSSQVVQAQDPTIGPTTMTANHTMTTTASANITSKDKNGSGRPAAFTLLLPLALAASLLHAWS